MVRLEPLTLDLCQGRDPGVAAREELYAGLETRMVLDIGGGAYGLKKKLERKACTRMIDLAYTGEDWSATHPGGQWDVVVASDIFPNVDQRLAEFLDWALPACRELRLSLTYWDEPKAYRAQRMCGERLTVRAWQREDILRVLASHVPEADLVTLQEYKGESLFRNERQLALLFMPGRLAP